MQGPVRWGILGAAKFAREHMGPAIHAAKGAELVALATADPARAEGFRAFAPGLRLHGSYEALLEDAGVEAVYIPLPNHLHVDWTIRALQAGKHVLCEKPLALAAADFARVIAARDATGLLAAEAFMIAHHPQWQRVRALIAEGAVGRLVHVDGAFTYNNPDPANIRNRPETGGGGIRDIGIYLTGATRLATGAEPEAIEARVRQENGVDAWAQATGVWAGGGHRFTWGAMTSTRAFQRQEIGFHGEAGLIRLTTPFNANVTGEAQVELRGPRSETVERFPGVNHYVLQVEAFGRALRGGAPWPLPLEWSRGTQEAIDRILSAARPR